MRLGVWLAKGGPTDGMRRFKLLAFIRRCFHVRRALVSLCRSRCCVCLQLRGWKKSAAFFYTLFYDSILFVFFFVSFPKQQQQKKIHTQNLRGILTCNKTRIKNNWKKCEKERKKFTSAKEIVNAFDRGLWWQRYLVSFIISFFFFHLFCNNFCAGDFSKFPLLFVARKIPKYLRYLEIFCSGNRQRQWQALSRCKSQFKNIYSANRI